MKDKLLYCLFAVLFLYSFSGLFAETYSGSQTWEQITQSNSFICTLQPGTYSIDMTGSASGSAVGPGSLTTFTADAWLSSPVGWNKAISGTFTVSAPTDLVWCGAWTIYFDGVGGGSYTVTITEIIDHSTSCKAVDHESTNPNCILCAVVVSDPDVLCGRCLYHDSHNHDTEPSDTVCQMDGGSDPSCAMITCPYCTLYFCSVHYLHQCPNDPINICVVQGGTSPNCSICGHDMGDGTSCPRCTYHDQHTHDDDPPPEPDAACPMGPDCKRCAFMDPSTGKVCGKCLTHNPHNHSIEPDPDPNNPDLPGLGAFKVKLPPNIKKIWDAVTDTVFVGLNSYSALTSGTPPPPKFEFTLENPFLQEYGGGASFNFGFDFATLPAWAVTILGAVRLILAWMCTWIFIFRILKIFRECGN